MILKHLSERDLQAVVGEELLDRLAILGPVLLGENSDPTVLYRKTNLLKVVSAFGPSQRMKNPAFMRTLLDSLPPGVIDDLVQATNVVPQSPAFSDKRDALLARGWNDKDFCTDFVAAAHLPPSFLPSFAAVVPGEELVAAASVPFKRLKNYQQPIHARAREALKPPRARFVIQMPTGSGKTRTAMELICDTLNDAGGTGMVVWLAHAEELCEQAIECFREVWSHLGLSSCRVVRVYGQHGLSATVEARTTFIVAGFQKLHRSLTVHPERVQRLADSLALLTIDEAHKVMAPTYEEVAKALIGANTRVIGLTATPGRGADNELGNTRLADFFFERVIGLEAPEGESVLGHLRRIGVLSHARMDRLRTSVSFSLTASQRSSLELNLDYPAGFLATLGDDDLRNIEIVRRLKSVCDGGSRVLFFACSVDHSRFVCAILLYLGIKAAHVDGATQPRDRGAVIQAFRSGEVQVLCNYGILSTGFDAPKTDVVFIARPTRSIVLYSQMIGRGLRGPAIGGTRECRIINVIDNIVGLPDNEEIYDYFEDYWLAEE